MFKALEQMRPARTATQCKSRTEILRRLAALGQSRLSTVQEDQLIQLLGPITAPRRSKNVVHEATNLTKQRKTDLFTPAQNAGLSDGVQWREVEKEHKAVTGPPSDSDSNTEFQSLGEPISKRNKAPDCSRTTETETQILEMMTTQFSKGKKFKIKAAVFSAMTNEDRSCAKT